jgi:uncharacterized delta-60 repeat protein
MKYVKIFIIASMFIYNGALAQPGTLDPTFGSGGKVTNDIGGADDKGVSLAIQGDGKLVVTGFSYNGSNQDVALARYQADGSLDSLFGTNGKVTTPVGNNDDYGLSVAIQTDGKLIVGGYSQNGVNNDFTVLRYKSNGTLDSTFGTNGIVITPVGSYGDNINSIAIQADGKIVAAGYSDTTTGDFFALVRYNSNGSMDPTFGSGGKVITHVGQSDDQINSIVIQGDGKIVAGGYSYNGADWDFALARYNTDGSPDNTFGTNGIVTTDIGNDDNMFYSVALQTDGKIVGGGWSGQEFAAARYNTDGSPDSTFGTAGTVTTAVGINDDGVAVAIQTDGAIVLAGNASNGSNDDFGLVRYMSDGSIDNTFGTGGTVITDFSNVNDNCLSIVIQPDHKIIVAGFTTNNARDFALARYDAGPVGINETNSTAIHVYPNPCSDELIVEGTKAGSDLLFYDLAGREVMRKPASISKTKIVTEKLLPGIYLLKYKSGKETRNEKVIKL